MNYSFVYNFGMISSVITMSLEGIWFPWFLQNISQHKIREINKMGENYTNFITYTMVCLLLVTPEIVKLLASTLY